MKQVSVSHTHTHTQYSIDITDPTIEMLTQPLVFVFLSKHSVHSHVYNIENLKNMILIYHIFRTVKKCLINFQVYYGQLCD